MVRRLERCVHPSVRAGFSRGSESLGVDVEVVSRRFGVGDGLFCGCLLVCFACVCSWAAPGSLAGGEDAVLFG